jgi:hypothetical protein
MNPDISSKSKKFDDNETLNVEECAVLWESANRDIHTSRRWLRDLFLSY